MPANALYGLVRFAAAHANEEWLDELVGGAATRIEETIRVRALNVFQIMALISF
jgi:hypothetical protein